MGLSSFVPFVNPQTRQNLASVINSDPQREQNILLLTLHRTLRLRFRLLERKRWETLRSTSRQLVSDITLKIRRGSLFSFLFAWFLFYLRGFVFVCVFSLLFACFLFCLRGFFFICVFSFLFAWFRFYLRGFVFVCLVSFLFACYLFYLRGFFFSCLVSFLFAWFLLYLQRVPCRPSYPQD